MTISLAAFFSSLEPSVSSELVPRDNAKGTEHAIDGFSRLLAGNGGAEGGTVVIDDALMQQSEMSDWVMDLLALIGADASVNDAIETSPSGIVVDVGRLQSLEDAPLDIEVLLSALPLNDANSKVIPATVFIESSAIQSLVQKSAPRLSNAHILDSNINAGGQVSGGIEASKDSVLSRFLTLPVTQGIGVVGLGGSPKEVFVAPRLASGQGVVLPTIDSVEKVLAGESRVLSPSSNSTTFHVAFSKAEHTNVSSFASKLASTLADKVHLLSATTKSDSVATLRMDPPDLGKVGVKLKLDGERLVVQVSASTNATRDALTDASDRLRAELSQYFAEVDVAVGQGSYDFYSELDDQESDSGGAIRQHDESRSVEQVDDGLGMDYLARV